MSTEPDPPWRTPRKRVLVLATGLALLGLGAGLALRARREPPATPLVPPLVPQRAAIDKFRQRLAADAPLVFRSHEGIAFRSDDDHELIFSKAPEQRIDLLEFGIGLEYYHGTYALDRVGRVAITWQAPALTYLPELQLLLDPRTQELLLRPVPDATHSEPADDCWNFRQLSGNAARQSLADLERSR